MSFYSYKNANSENSPGEVCGNILNGLNKRVCIQVKNVYDSALSQQQLDDEEVTIENIVPVLPGCGCNSNSNASCRCNCTGNQCSCRCGNCSTPISHAEAVENAENSNCQLPQPCGAWTFESCRSSTTEGNISNLSIERLCDRPQYARVKCSVDVPVDVLFMDQRCQEWMGQSHICVDKDVLLCVPEDSVVPFTIESLVSAICVSGSYIGNCTFEITVCVTVVLKVLAEVDIMIPTYGFCEIPPAEEFSENICDEFFALPLFPQSSCLFDNVCENGSATGTATAAMGGSYACGSVARSGGCGCASSSATGTASTASTCSNCGTTCLSGTGSLCPRCGCAMTGVS